MPKTRTNVYKRKDGRWEGRYIKKRDENGKAIYGSVYARNYHDVCTKLSDAKKKSAALLSEGYAHTVSEIGSEWLKEKSGFVKKSSLNKYEDILNLYIEPSLGDCTLSEVTNRQLIDFGNKLLIQGGANQQGLSKSTVMEVMSTMNGLRIYALRRNYAVSFATECFDIKRDAEDTRVFTKDEEEKLVDWLCSHFNLTALAILICLFTGLRVGEICALKWNDVDFDQDVIHVRHTMQRIRVSDNKNRKTEVQIHEPKSECSKRKIPIPNNLRDLLHKNYEEGAFVTTGKKKKYVEPRTMENRLHSILKKADIEDANFHTIRHSFATRCVEEGVDIKCLSEILGHASVSITLNRYVHPSLNLKAENMAKMSSAFPIPATIG